MNKQYILFDLDGTLTDPKEGITSSVAYALAQYGIETDSLDSLVPFIGPPLLDSFQRFYGFDKARALEAVGHYRVRFSQKGIFENRVYDGVPQMLAQLRAQGKTLVLATSKPEVYARQILEHFSIDKYFDCICGATMDESRNNKSAVVAYALETAGVSDPSSAIMVGDRFHDVEGAHQNGLQAIGVLFGYGTLDELTSAGADLIARDVEHLTGLLKGE